MAIAKDALSTSNLASYTHTPVGTPRGVLVMIPNESATDQVTGVTYGGVAMTEITLSPLVATGAEGGVLHGFFLGSSVPTGAQTVEATIVTGSPHIITQTVTAAADTEIVDTGTIDLTAVTGAQTGTLSTGGRNTVVVEVGWCSGSAATATTQLTNWTGHNESDEGAEINFRYSYDIVGTADVTFGVTITGTEDIAVLAAAIGEVVSGSTYTLDADAASYTYTATAAGLEFDRLLNADAASYTYTATAAGLEFDRQIAADAASYTWTATDAALEYDQQLVAESAAYLWTATDAALEYTPAASTYTLDADGAAYLWTASDAGLEYSGEQTQRPTGGWSRLPPEFGRPQTKEARRLERERLGILPKQQRAIDRAAVKIAASAPTITRGGLLSAPQVIAAPAFDRLLGIVQPTEGQVLALAQAIVDRIAWIVAQQQAEDDETEMLLRLMMEM
jgi:hypothetical protein